MATIAYGASKVKALQQALGGKPPARSRNDSRAQLDQFLAARSKSRQTGRAEMARLTQPIQSRLLNQLAQDDPEVERSIKALHELRERRRKQRKTRRPEKRKVEPCFITGSNFWVKAPPYDDAWTASPERGTAADKVAGDYTVQAYSGGAGSIDAGAGLGVWFYCSAYDPMQRVSALLDYTDDWWDSAFGYVGHNDLRTRIWVWGNSEQDWVVRSDLSPSRSDGVSWFEDHESDPNADSGRISLETFFPAQANSWYEAWVWSEGSVFADGGPLGSDSYVYFSASVPLVVFGSLF